MGSKQGITCPGVSSTVAASNIPQPKTRAELLQWVWDYMGIRIADQSVCLGHTSPADYFTELVLNRPQLALVLGPRGGGKSFLSALDTHYHSRWNAKHGTKILGGSKSQSEQVYRALREAVYEGHGDEGSDAESIAKLMKGEAVYHNGSNVAILTASSKSVRGPHVASLKLDEVDEIESDLREAAMGMCMNRHGSSASVIMTSTWHRLNGPMGVLMERAAENEFPHYSFCTFEILERCSAERSGPWVGGERGYENCPKCPLKPWCHAERDRNGDVPLAKRSNGHYDIDSLIQKARSVSIRTFESDYLCQGPRSDGVWFKDFDMRTHVSTRAEYDPRRVVQVAIDSGVFTGAVFFQLVTEDSASGPVESVHVFAEYLAENGTAELNARSLVEVSRKYCEGRLDALSTDSAGGSRNPIGPTVISEYERGGLKQLIHWPQSSVSDGLALIESFVSPADGVPRFTVHPRCTGLIRAFQNYRRAKRVGQWQDYPQDPQHPHEDLMDALRGGLRLCYPQGRVPLTNPALSRVPARRVF